VFLTLATISGRWTRDTTVQDIWNENGLWESCVCHSVTLDDCQTRNDYVRTVAAFSLIEVCAEGLAVALLLAEWFVSRGARSVWVFILVFYAAATAANIVTWTTYSSYYRRKGFCSENEPNFKDNNYDLSWGFGVRLLEFGGLILITILAFVNLGKGSKDRSGLLFATVFIALFLLHIGILTTSGRGWMHQDVPDDSFDTEVGLFDSCQCVQNFDLSCSKAKKRTEGAQTFSVVSIVFQFILVLLLLRGSATLFLLNVQRLLTALNFGAILITLCVFAEYASAVQCGQQAITESQKFHWAFGIEAASLILQAFLFVFLVAMPVVPEEKSSEPAA